MAIRPHYLDASALVKLFVAEPDAAAIREYYQSQSVFYTTTLCFGEALGILKAKRLRGELKKDKYLEACAELITMVRDEIVHIEEVSITDATIYTEVEALADQYGLDVSDAFQLVTIKRGFTKVFGGDSKTILITADKQLANAARDEKLRVWDCIREKAP